ALPMQSDLGIYRPLLDRVLAEQGATLAYLARDWPDAGAWRALARGKLLELLAFTPPAAPLDARVERRVERDGGSIEETSWGAGRFAQRPLPAALPGPGAGHGRLRPRLQRLRGRARARPRQVLLHRRHHLAGDLCLRRPPRRRLPPHAAGRGPRPHRLRRPLR